MMLRIALQMAKVNLLSLRRDRKALLFLVLLPVALMAILSFALSGTFGGKGLPAVTVAVVNQDQGPAAGQLIHVLKGQTKLIHLKTAATIQQARSLVNDGQAAVDVWIHPGFSQAVASGQKGAVAVESQPGHEVGQSIVQSLVEDFGDEAGVVRTMAGIDPQAVAHASQGAVHFDEQTSALRPMTSGAYYAIGMMVMFMLTHAISRAEVTVEEKNSDRYKRILASPSSRVALAGGHWIANFLVMVLQGVVLLLCARWLLNVHLGPVVQTAMLVIAYAAALAGISSILGSWFKNQRVVDGLGMVGSQVASVLGGSIFPIYGFPKVMQWLAHILPNGRALSALVNSVMGISTSQLFVPICYLLCLGLILGLLAGVRYGQPAR